MEVQHPNPLQAAIGNFQRFAASAFKQDKPPRSIGLGAWQNRRQQHQQQPKRVTFARAAPFAAIIPGDTVAELVFTNGINNFLNLYNTALIVRLVLTWFPSPPAFLVGPLATLCDPYLNLFRGIIPPLGGTLDFSPILAFVVLSVFTNTAAALPCELGPDGRAPAAASQPQQQEQGLLEWLPISRFQRAWAQRLQGARAHQQQQE